MADKIKLGEISKNLKITNKDIIAKLAEFGVLIYIKTVTDFKISYCLF